MNENMLRWSGPWALVVALCLTCVGCSGQHINVAQADPVESALDAQSVELRNCETKAEMRQSLASEVTIEKQITIADEATAAAGGETAEIPPEMKAKLAAEIEGAYEEMYETAKIGVEQTELTVPVGRIHTYRIEWKKQVFSSSVSFSMNGETYTVLYTYELSIPNEVGFREMSCTA